MTSVVGPATTMVPKSSIPPESKRRRFVDNGSLSISGSSFRNVVMAQCVDPVSSQNTPEPPGAVCRKSSRLSMTKSLYSNLRSMTIITITRTTQELIYIYIYHKSLSFWSYYKSTKAFGESLSVVHNP